MSTSSDGTYYIDQLHLVIPDLFKLLGISINYALKPDFEPTSFFAIHKFRDLFILYLYSLKTDKIQMWQLINYLTIFTGQDPMAREFIFTEAEGWK